MLLLAKFLNWLARATAYDCNANRASNYSNFNCLALATGKIALAPTFGTFNDHVNWNYKVFSTNNILYLTFSI